MAKIQEPPEEVRGGSRRGPLMSPGVGFVVVLLGFVLVLGAIGLYVRGRQQGLEASPVTTAPATSRVAKQPTAQSQPTPEPQLAPTQAAAPPAVASTAVPTPVPATEVGPAPQATAIPTVQPAAAAPAAQSAGQPTSLPAAASGAAEGVRPALTAQPTAPPATPQASQSGQGDADVTDERIPLAVTGDIDPALVSELEHAYWLYCQRDAEADATLDADVMRPVADEDTVNGTAKLYDQWRAQGHAVHTDLRHQATLLSATPDRAVIFDIQEDHSYFVSLATGEPEQPYPDVATIKVLYQFSKIGDTWKQTGEELP